tara:strand:- start:94 stop:1866 length:1773 start_codon:yes stop_codon:yes gene_type:complete
MSCNPEYHNIGTNLLIDQAFETDVYRAKVFSYQKKLKKIQTDGLPLGQLGKINHSFYGESKASITSQLIISNNPIFGIYSQDTESSETADTTIIPENETVTSVYLEIPFYSNQNDKDNDGLIDKLDSDPLDPASDTDGDGLTDFSENAVGTNPLSSDSDNDGILDNEDTDSSSYEAENRLYDIDSVYGNPEARFTMKVHELTYYLSSLDPENNFESAQQFFSDTNYYDQGFYSTELFNQEIGLNFEELRFNYTEDDPLTEEVEDSTSVQYRSSPRIRLELEPSFFQKNIINAEGSSRLQNLDNFQNHIKGLIISAENFTDDLYLLLNFNAAGIKINYDYDYYEGYGTLDVADDEIVKKSSSYDLALGGIVINSLEKSGFDPSISNSINIGNTGVPQNDLIIQGGQFYSKIDLFDSTSLNDNDELLQLRSKNWLINEASLVFYVDPNQPLQNANNVYPERLYLYNLESGLPINDFLIDNTINTLSTNAGKKVFGGLLEYDSDDKPWRYKFRITDHLNKIIRKDSVNSSLALISGANISALSIKKALNSSDEPIKLPATGILNPFGVKLVGSHPEEPLKDKKIELEIYYTNY